MRGIGKQYNAEADYAQRVEEMRADWESAMAARVAEKEIDDSNDVFDDGWSSEVSTFFERTRGNKGQGMGGNGTTGVLSEKEEEQNGVQ